MEDDRERSPRPRKGKGKGKQLVGRGPDGVILLRVGDDRADWLTHHTRTGIHHVPVRWDGLGKPHIPMTAASAFPTWLVNGRRTSRMTCSNGA